MINLALQTLRTNLPIQTQVPVRVIDDESQARLIFDPMRREMLRLLSRKPLTETELSNTICISPPTVHHHLKAVMRGDLISMVRKEVGAHGIVQKRYASNAQAYIVDRDNLRNSVRRCFMPMGIERSREIKATVSFLRGTVAPSTKQMKL